MSVSIILLSIACAYAPAEPASDAGALAPPAAPAPTVRKKTCPKGKKRCRRRREPEVDRPREPEVDPRVVAAEAERARVLAVMAPMVAAGRHRDAARGLAIAAEAASDPLLYLAAAEAELSAGRLDDGALQDALRWTVRARSLAPAPDLDGHGLALATWARGEQARRRRLKRARAQTIVGGVFAALGLGGLGLVTSGAVLAGKVHAARGAYEGSDVDYLRTVARVDARADAMLAAGLVVTLAGAAFGIPLTITGIADVRRSSTKERPALRILPGLAGMSLAGRF